MEVGAGREEGEAEKFHEVKVRSSSLVSLTVTRLVSCSDQGVLPTVGLQLSGRTQHSKWWGGAEQRKADFGEGDSQQG
jgi:hypothetical protein